MTQTDAAEDAYQAFIHANLRRNYAGHFLHGMLGMTGFRLVNAPTFVPAYLHLISGSEALVGLGLALQQVGGIASQIFGAHAIEHRKRVMPVAMALGLGMRLPVLGLALAGWTLTGTPLLVAVLACLFVFGLFSGPQRVTFQLLLAKVIPVRLRGRLQAWRNAVGGLVAATLAYVAGHVLIEGNVTGNGYAATFLLAFGLTSLGLVALRVIMREPEPPEVRDAVPIRERLRDFPALIASDKTFASFMVALALANLGRMAAPFYVIHAGRVMGLGGAEVGVLSLAYLGADTLANLAWGYLGDRMGFRRVLIGALGLWFAAMAMLMIGQDVAIIIGAFLGLGAAQAGYQMAFQTMVLEFGAREDIAMRLALVGTVETALAALAPLLGGLIAVATGLMPVFGLSLVCLAAALIMVATRVSDPRFTRP